MRVRVVPLVLLLTLALEVVVLVLVGHLIGFGLALLLLLVVSLVGGFVLKREGVRAWARFEAVARAGDRPGPHLTRSVVGLLGAVLLVLPGFVSGVVGALLFVPPVRSLAGRGVAGLAGRRLPSAAMGDLFGPRRVRVKVGQPRASGGPQAPAGSAGSGYTSGSSRAGEVVEGEIIDPR